MEDPLYFWRLAPDLSVEDAAILLAGGNPETYRWPDGFPGAFESLQRAILKGQLKAELAYPIEMTNEGDTDLWPSTNQTHWLIGSDDLRRLLSALEKDPFTEIPPDLQARVVREPDWSKTLVDVEDLRTWLRSRGVRSGFFFPVREADPDDFLDPAHDHFSPELALAVTAWRALAGKSRFPRGVKAAIEDWIERNPNAWQGDEPLKDKTKDRVVVLINWNPKGGRSKQSSET